MTGTEIKGLKKSLEHGVKYLWEGYGVVIYGTQPHKDGFLRYTLDLYAPDGQLMLDHGIKSAWQVRQIVEGKKTVITEGGAKKKVTASSVGTAEILKLEVSTPAELTEKVINTLITDCKHMETYLSLVAPYLADDYTNLTCNCIDTIAKGMKRIFDMQAYEREEKAALYQIAQKEKEAAEAREQRITDLTRRLQVLKDYIVQYDSKIGAAFVAGNIEQAQMLSIQKKARIERTSELINTINMMIEA